jgi:hypothetical protein
MIIPIEPPVTAEFDLSMNKPGIYVGGGIMYSFGKMALDISPRFNYVMNDGDYDFDVTADGYTETFTMTKDYKDMYVDVLFGVDYFFM